MNISLNLGAIHKLRNPPRGREGVTEMIILDYGGEGGEGQRLPEGNKQLKS